MVRFLRQGLVFLAVAITLYALAMLVLARVRFQGYPPVYRPGSSLIRSSRSSTPLPITM